MFQSIAQFVSPDDAVPVTLPPNEVCTVGDEAFRKKCRDKMSQFKAESKTIFSVSHALDAVNEMCQRSILLNEYRIVSMGGTEKVINDYRVMLQKARTR
jgi:ABC-type polysaccharide/polyol phosphate transport system ATPase subunit